MILNQLDFYLSRHKIVIAGNHEITFDRKSFENPYAKKKVFGENFNPSDLEVGYTEDLSYWEDEM